MSLSILPSILTLPLQKNVPPEGVAVTLKTMDHAVMDRLCLQHVAAFMRHRQLCAQKMPAHEYVDDPLLPFASPHACTSNTGA